MTRALDNNLYVDLMLATTLEDGGQQVLERVVSVLAGRKYSQSIKDKREDVCGTHLRSTLYGQPPSKPSLDSCSDL